MNRTGGQMTTRPLEAFSDGVIAIIITIMVLEMKIPRGSGLEDLRPLLPVFLPEPCDHTFSPDRSSDSRNRCSDMAGSGPTHRTTSCHVTRSGN